MRAFLTAFSLCLLLVPLAQASSGGEGGEAGKEANTRGYEYIEFTPGFTVNFASSGKVGFVKAEVSLKVASAARAQVEEHMPAIRHTLIMLLSRQDDATIAAGEPREALRVAALEAVRSLMSELAETPPEEIQDLLFTGFISQR